MNITQDLITVNFTKRLNRKIEYIVVHYFGGLGTDEGVVNYFDRDATNASAHYALDDDSITQAVLDENVAWHCGDKGIGVFKRKCQNSNSIGIEVRPYKIDGIGDSAADADWYFHEQTIINLTELVKSLMAKHSIDADHVIRHYDVTAKLCPRPWVGDDINTYYGKTGNQLWAEFKASLEDEEMTGKDIFEKLDEYLKTLPASDYAKASSELGVKSKVFSDGDKDGLIDNPQGILRRQELAVVLNRLGLLGK